MASGKIAALEKEPDNVEDWSPDGRSILGINFDETRLSLLALADGAKPQTLLTTPYRMGSFRFSPDGKYVVYRSFEAAREEVYVASFPSFSVKRLVSTGGGGFPIWAQGSKELFYRAPDGTLMDVEIRLGSTIEAGIPKPLFKFGAADAGNRFGVTPDGQHFLMNEPVRNLTPEAQLTVVINWVADMKP